MQNLNVLVLEDEPLQRLVTVTALKKVMPGQVHEAASGSEALALLEHWFMVLPLPSEKLWDWGMRSRTPHA